MALNEAYYTLPKWFFDRNVTTAQDFESAKPARLDDLHPKTITELRDATCASFRPHDEGLIGDSTIVFCMKDQGTRKYVLEPAWMRRAVTQSTKALEDTSLVYLDLGILEQLGSEFHQQDQQRADAKTLATGSWKPNTDSSTTFLERFFAIHSKAHANKQSWKRRHHSLSAVLDAAATARAIKMQEGDGIDAVVVQILMDGSVNEFLARRVLGRFAEMVQGRREQGEAVTILLSTKSSLYMPGMQGFTEIGGTEVFTADYDKTLGQPEGDSEQTTEDSSDTDDTQQTRQTTPATTPPDSESDDESKGWSVEQEWERQKSQDKCHNAALDSLMNLVGLEGPKSKFMAIKNRVTVARRQASLTQERFGAVFVGGPGSGKSTVAELYAKFLSLLGLVPRLAFKKTTGTRLAAGGPNEVAQIIESLETTGGVILIDDVHELASDGAKTSTFYYLMDEVRRLEGEVVFVFTGPRDKMRMFMDLSPEFRSYFPLSFDFDDFTDGELHQLLVQQLHSRFNGKMRVEGGMNGVFMRVLARRIGRGRGSGCFANVLEVQNMIRRVLYRQGERLNYSRRFEEYGDIMFLTQRDLLGPPPTATLNSTAWKSLQEMTGLASVKKSVRALITRQQTNYERELAEEPLLETSLNKVFLGGPGTGKTTVAKHYAEILTDLGLLSNGEIVVRSCKDFFGSYTGESIKLTKAILDSAQGKVLIIDEAYGLAQTNTDSDSLIDTIVAQVQATSTEDRAVLLLGYKDKMEEMFRTVNPGLARRFPISSAFDFQDFSDEELRNILDDKLRAQELVASEQAKQVAMEVLSRARNRQNSGNAGEVDILLDRAKMSQEIRLDGSKGTTSTPLRTELKEEDFDPEFDRSDQAGSNIQEDFADFVGAEALVAQFHAYQRIAENSKNMGLDPRELVPFNFLFRGPPGNGKTTAARKLGRIFFDMGFLATKEVEVCSASELIGECHAETGPKTQRVFQKALGKVLVIDEAYRLGAVAYRSDGGFNHAHAKYKNNIVVVVLAGYDREMNQLLANNPGLGSRFSEVIQFTSLSPKHCYDLLVRLLQDKKLDVSGLHRPYVAKEIQACFQTLSDLPNWGNARDVENLAKSLFGRIISSPVSSPSLEVAPECASNALAKMITERRNRTEDAFPHERSSRLLSFVNYWLPYWEIGVTRKQ